MKRFLMTLIILYSTVPISFAGTITVTANWTNPTTGATATGTRIERNANNGGWTMAGSVAPTATMFTDSAQPLGITYQYRIIRFNAAGDSPPTDPFTVMTAAPDGVSNSAMVYSYGVTLSNTQTTEANVPDVSGAASAAAQANWPQ